MEFTASSLFASLVVSTVGFSIFVYGKKQRRSPQLAAGLVLMVFPYAVGDPGWMAAIAAAIVVALWFAVRQGL